MDGLENTPEDLADSLGRTSRLRHQRRSRRKNYFMLAVLGMLALLVVGAPSILCHSPMGRSMVASSLAQYGLQGRTASIRIGWSTPLRLQGLQVDGASGLTRLTVDQIDADVTVMDLVRGKSPTSHIIVSGVDLQCQVSDGRCSLEDDLATVFNTPSSDEPTVGHIELTDVTARISDATSGQSWQLTQAAAKVDMTAEAASPRTNAEFTGVLTEQGAGGGAIEGSIDFADTDWSLRLTSDSLPLSVASIVRRRFPESATAIPPVLQGDATGEIILSGGGDTMAKASIRSLSVRDLTALDDGTMDLASDGQRSNGQRSNGADRGEKLLWQNSLATVDGDLLLTQNRLIGKRLVATSDFGTIKIDGAFSRDFSWTGTSNNPLRWLEGIDGFAEIDLDLPKLQSSLPGVLPIRSGAELASGRATASVRSLPTKSESPNANQARSEVKITSNEIRARSGGRNVLIDPIEFSGIVASHPGGVQAERFQWSSSFGQAVGQGDLKSGTADIEVDFGRLFAMLQPVIDLSDMQLSGIAKGEIRWQASEDESWNLNGRGNAKHLLITLPSGQRFQRNSIDGDIQAVGQWKNQSLQQLAQVVVNLSSDSLRVKAELLEPVDQPTLDVPMSVGIQSSGDLETLQQIAGPWCPPSLKRMTGQYESSAITSMSASAVKLQRIRARCNDLFFAYADRSFRQSSFQLSADGDFDAINLVGDGSLKIESDAMLAAIQGDVTTDNANVDIKWQANLEGLQGVSRRQIASRPEISRVSFEQDAAAISQGQWAVMGTCSGTCKIKKVGEDIEIVQDTEATDFAIVQPSSREQLIGTDGSIRFADREAKNDSRIAWLEPNLKIAGSIRTNDAATQFRTDGLDIAGDWFAWSIAGDVQINDKSMQANLNGPARLKMDDVANKLRDLAGIEIVLAGVHETPLSVRIEQPLGQSGAQRLDATTEIGWDSGEVAGVKFGNARVPIQITQDQIVVSPTRIPVGDGFVRAAGQVFYQDASPSIRLEPGVVADSIKLTPELTDRWLKYLAPVAADTARISGVLSARVREANLNLDDPNRTRIVGQIDVEGVEMAAGPLADQILAGVNQMSSLATLVGGRATNAKAGQTLITMPVQTVDFSIDRGIVSHDRMYFRVDRASVVTSGQVGFDGRLGMTAQVPLDARWLGQDLQGLAGQSITLPIDGTISRPSVDSAGVSRVVKDLGVKAIQQTTESYLQKQFERGFEKILGR